MNKTLKDFEKEVTRVTQSYRDDHIKYGNIFKTHETHENGYHVFFITNHLISSLVKFDENYGFLDTANIGMAQLDKLKSMQAEIQGSFQ